MIENPIFAERSQAYVSLRHIGNELRKASSRHLARLGTTDASLRSVKSATQP